MRRQSHLVLLEQQGFDHEKLTTKPWEKYLDLVIHRGPGFEKPVRVLFHQRVVDHVADPV